MSGQYLQLDIGSSMIINNVTTQGRPNTGQWITSYSLYYINVGNVWTFFGTLDGNTDTSTQVTHSLNNIVARYVRIYPITLHSYASIRVGLISSSQGMCSPGTYSTAIGASSSGACISCGGGSYSSDFAASTCSLCDKGTYSMTLAATSSATCSACAAGSYAGAPGSASCSKCPMASYSGASGATACSPCPEFTNTTSATATSVLDCACVAGRACTYTMRITVLIHMQNTTLATFDSVGLIITVAVAARVPVGSVTLISVSAGGTRRLLSADTLRVRLSVAGARNIDSDEVRRSAPIHKLVWMPRHTLRVAEN